MAKFRGSTVGLFLRLLVLTLFWILLAWTFWAYSQQMNEWVQTTPTDKLKAYDFKLFYQGSYDFVNGGSLYRASEGSPFVLGRIYDKTGNSPVGSLLHLPLFLFPLETALSIWNIITFSLFCLSLILIWSVYKNYLPKKLHWLALLFVFLYISWPVIETLQLGTWGLLIAFLDVACWYSARKGYDKLAGVFLGLAICFRWQPFIIFFLFLVLKRPTVVVATLVTIFVSYLCAVLVFGTASVFEFADMVLTFVGNKDGLLTRGADGSLRSFLGRFFEVIPNSNAFAVVLTALWAVLAVALVLATLWRCIKIDFNNAFSLCIVCGLLLAPTSWMHYHVALVLPIVVVVFVQKQVWVGIFFGLLWFYPHFLVNLLTNLTNYNMKQLPLVFSTTLTVSLFILYFYLFRSKNIEKEDGSNIDTAEPKSKAEFATN